MVKKRVNYTPIKTNKKVNGPYKKEKTYNQNDPFDLLMQYLDEGKNQSYLPNPQDIIETQGFQNELRKSTVGYKEPIQQEQVDDIGSFLGYTAQEFGQGLASGFGNTVGGISDAISAGLDSPVIEGMLFDNTLVKGVESTANYVIDKFNPETDFDINFKETLQNGLDNYSDAAFDFANSFQDDKYVTDNGVINFASNVAGGIGGMVPQILASMAGGAPASLGLLAAQSYGSGYNEAMQDGAEQDKARLYGLANAGVELATEKLTGGIPFFGKGGLDGVIDNAVSKISNNALRKGAKIGADMLGEGLEEYISTVAGEFTPDIYKDYEGDENLVERVANVQPEALYSGAVGGVTAALLNTPSYIINGIEPKPVIDKEFLDKNKTPIQQENNSIVNLQANNVVNQQPVNVAQNALNSPNIEPQAQPINEVNLNASNVLNDNALNANELNNQPTIEQSRINDNITQGLKADNNLVKMKAQRVNTENIKRSAKLYKIDNETADRVSEVSNGLGVQVEFVDSLPNGAEGEYRDGVIRIAKDTVNPVNQVYKHELTHHLEQTKVYNDFKDTVFKIMQLRNVDIDTVRNNIKQRYLDNGVDLVSNEDVDHELVSIFTQDGIFQDKNTIDDIANINIGVAQKIWNWIKEKVYSFSTDSKEKAYLLKAERLYREAIEQANKKSTVQNNAKYSIDLNNDVITDTKNPDYYKYDNLIKLNDINVANYTSVDLSNYSMAELVQESKKRALENGGISVDDNTNTYFVINNGEEIKVSRSGLIHSKSKASNDRKNLIINTGELLTNAIKVNEVVRNGKTSSVYFNEYVQDGNKYICRFIVNDDVLSDVIHKKLYAPSQYPIEKGRNSATGAPTSPFRIPSNISVKQMLEDVNSTSMIKRDLPLDVYYRFNDEYVAEGRDLEGYKYSIGESIRNLIDNDLDNDIETKQKQLDIILKENPVHDDYHTWIRGVDDIKTYEEALKDSDYYEYLDDGFDESYTPDMVLDALERGEIKVYSSYPIKNGTFVTPSKMEAQSYAGEGKVYSKTVKLDKVAWIDPTQGMYADTSRKYSLGTSLNRLDSSKELKSKVVGYNSLQSNYKKKIIATDQDEYRGTDIDAFLNYAADETLKTGSISESTRKEIVNELYNENYRLIEDDDNTYNELVNYFEKNGIVIDQQDKAGVVQVLDRYGYNKNSKKVNGIPIKFVDSYDSKNFYLDQAYGELRELFPGKLPDAYNVPDEVEAIMDLVEQTKPQYEKAEVSEEYRKYIEDEVNSLLDDYQYEVIYRSDKSNYDKYIRKLAKERGKFNQSVNTDILSNSEELAEDFTNFKDNIDEYIDSVGTKYSDMRPYVSIMNDYKNYNKTLSQVNDVVANKDKNIRKYLYDHTEKLVFDAGKSYADNRTSNLTKVHDIIEKYGIKPGSKESAALQRYGEGFYQKYTKEKIVINGKEETSNVRTLERYGLDELKKDIPDSKMQENIIAADKEIRKIYDDYAKRMNQMLEGVYSEKSINEEALKQKDAIMLEINSLRNTLEKLESVEKKTPMLLAQINKVKSDIRGASTRFNNVDKDVRKNKRLNLRDNYYHHYNESNSIFDIFKNREIKINNELSGISEFTKPKAKWQSWMQERNDFGEYKEDAIGGLLKYIDEAENAIAYDPVINELRDFNKALVKYSNEEEINNSNYIEFLNDYTNDIAGKTGFLDRPIQKITGRNFIRVLGALNNMAKKNAVYGNFRSAVAQFFNLPNSVAILNANGGIKGNADLAKGAKDYASYIQSKFKGNYLDNPIQESAFLSQRYNDKIDRQFNYSKFKNLKNLADTMMTVGDQTIAEITWFSAYEQGKRLKKSNPIEYADDLTRRAIAGRGVGEVPLTQKTKLVKFLVPFQVEVNNSWNLTKDLVSKKQFGALATMFATTYLMNTVADELMGARYGIDLIDALMDAFKMVTSDDEKEKGNPVGRVAGEVVSNIPYANAILPYLMDDYTSEAFFGEADPTRYGQVNLVGDFVQPVLDFANGKNIDYTGFLSNFMPGAGKQLDRTYKYLEDKGILPRVDISNKGISVSKKEGAYNDKGQLKYVIDDDIPDNIKGAMFGTYATDAGKEYLDEGYSALSEKKTKAVENLSNKDHDVQKVYEAMRHVSTISGITDVSNSKAAKVREYLENEGLYNDIVKGADSDTLQSWGLNKTVAEMSESEFKTQLKMLEQDAPTSYSKNDIKKIDALDNYVSTENAAQIIDHIDDIESLKKNGKSISNSKSALIREYLEDRGLYGKLSSSLSDLGVSDTVIGMTQAEFDEFMRTKIDPYR